jgi:hypothetical protein
MLTKNKKKIIVSVQITIAAMLMILPWVALAIGVKFHSNSIWQCVEIIYACELWWWLVAIVLAVLALVETVCWKLRGLMAITIFLLLIIPIAGFVWGMLITLGKHPPA